ncbi:MSHA biogenesis protein MshP [Vibrio owensii]|uniref:MSHA biogenesis protein MshP n=1 Tax=Vibrio owensii TaxID=696485 RepID=UPI00339335AC
MFHRRKPQGNVLIIVLFVIIVMGFLAASLMRVNWSNQSTLTREFLGTKAWFIAQSANDWALTRLYPLGDKEPNVADLCSDTVSGAIPNIAVGTGCELKAMTCSEIGTFNKDVSDAVSLFKVQARATCGSGVTIVQRQQEIWVREYQQ